MRAAHRSVLPGSAAALRAGALAILLLASPPVVLDAVALPPPAADGGSGSSPLAREELMHSFDLDFNGKIDQSEAEIARSKMRLRRMEEMRRDRIDPVTGRKVGEIEDEKAAAKAGRRPSNPTGVPSRPILGIDDLLGGEGPDRSVLGGRTGADPAAAVGTTKNRRTGSPWQKGAKPAASTAAGDAATARGKERAGAATGGVRAGAPPARPGYGAPSAPKETKPLNAGRPIGGPSPETPAAGAGRVPGGAVRGATNPPAGVGAGRTAAPR